MRSIALTVAFALCLELVTSFGVPIDPHDQACKWDSDCVMVHNDCCPTCVDSPVNVGNQKKYVDLQRKFGCPKMPCKQIRCSGAPMVSQCNQTKGLCVVAAPPVNHVVISANQTICSKDADCKSVDPYCCKLCRSYPVNTAQYSAVNAALQRLPCGTIRCPKIACRPTPTWNACRGGYCSVSSTPPRPAQTFVDVDPKDAMCLSDSDCVTMSLSCCQVCVTPALNVNEVSKYNALVAELSCPTTLCRPPSCPNMQYSTKCVANQCARMMADVI